MTDRERFRMTMDNDPSVDRCPVIEWATWWDKTLESWADDIPKNISKMEFFDFMGLSRQLQFWFRHKKKTCPAPKYHGAPLIKDAADYKNIKKHLFPKDAVKSELTRLNDEMPDILNGNTIVWYTLEGFFWFPRTLLGIEGHLYAYYDLPELYHDICRDLLEWELGVVEEFSKYVKADFMTLAEDMSYNLGPMISRECFEEFVTPYYKQLLPEVKKYGARVIIDSDGDISSAIPWFIEAGVEGALPLERQAGVNIRQLQEDYPEFFWIGGYDKMALLKGKDAIDAEFERLLPAIKRGRFIPSVDHQTPPGVSIETYRYYTGKLRVFCKNACKR